MARPLSSMPIVVAVPPALTAQWKSAAWAKSAPTSSKRATSTPLFKVDVLTTLPIPVFLASHIIIHLPLLEPLGNGLQIVMAPTSHSQLRRRILYAHVCWHSDFRSHFSPRTTILELYQRHIVSPSRIVDRAPWTSLMQLYSGEAYRGRIGRCPRERRDAQRHAQPSDSQAIRKWTRPK